MVFQNQTQAGAQKELSPSDKSILSAAPTSSSNNADGYNAPVQTEEARVTALALALGGVASIGGFMFGYEAGQIGGFLAMPDFITRFGENGTFAPTRAGLIVGLLCIGTLIGCLGSAYFCDKLGRRATICASSFVYIAGVIIEITSTNNWIQFAMGRLVAGLGIGATSTSVPMYQSESVPKTIRAVVVSSYQLMITLGIFAACIANYATDKDYDNSAQWRIPNGLSALWALIMGAGILCLPESPRFAYRKGQTEYARKIMAKLNGVAVDSSLIDEEVAAIEKQMHEEEAHGKAKWHEVLTGPRMLYRTLLGMAMQGGQQMTGVNFFFYFGTTIFRSTGISNSFITSIILASVNVLATIFALLIVQKVGRRPALMTGAAVMAICFLGYTFVGTYCLNAANPSATPGPGYALIALTCVFIAAFATTWGPLPWAVVSELYPPQHRATAMALATSANWTFNFLISITTSFIVAKIRYWYGMVFAVSCIGLVAMVHFYVCETKDRSLEEVDAMYVQKMNPRKSAQWRPEIVPVSEVTERV